MTRRKAPPMTPEAKARARERRQLNRAAFKAMVREALATPGPPRRTCAGLTSLGSRCMTRIAAGGPAYCCNHRYQDPTCPGPETTGTMERQPGGSHEPFTR